jgi:hypothetical protein
MNYSLLGGLHQYRISYFPHVFEKSYFSYTANFTESFKLPGNYSIELLGYYNSFSYYSNSRPGANSVFNLGFKKDINNHNGSIQLSISDVFGGNSYHSQLGVLTTDAFESNVKVDYHPESYFFPIIRLTYFRSFGSNSTKTSRKDNGAKEEQNRL